MAKKSQYHHINITATTLESIKVPTRFLVYVSSSYMLHAKNLNFLPNDNEKRSEPGPVCSQSNTKLVGLYSSEFG